MTYDRGAVSRVAVSLLCVICTSCNFTPGASAPQGEGDAQMADDAALADMLHPPDAPIDGAPLGPWGNVTQVIPGPGVDDPTLTADLLELYYNASNNIYGVRRAAIDQPWGAPVLVSALSSGAAETTPDITGDGLTMYLASQRSGTGTLGGYDIWVATRPDRNTTWSTPVHVPELSSNAFDAGAVPTDDLLTLVLTSDRAGGLGGADIYTSARAAATAPWSPPVAVANVNGTSNDYSPMLSQDRLSLYFDSPRSGNSDLYVATRASAADPFGTPVPISELNTGGSEDDIWVSPDQRTLFFVRGGAIYQATR
jgi:hypothetical protein